MSLKLVAATFACLAIGLAFSPELVQAATPRLTDQCDTTMMKIATKTYYSGGAVFEKTRLSAGSGSLDCLNMCKGNEDCWSFNYEKNRKSLSSLKPAKAALLVVTASATQGANETWSNEITEFPRFTPFNAYVYIYDYAPDRSQVFYCTGKDYYLTSCTATTATTKFGGAIAASGSYVYIQETYNLIYFPGATPVSAFYYDAPVSSNDVMRVLACQISSPGVLQTPCTPTGLAIRTSNTLDLEISADGAYVFASADSGSSSTYGAGIVACSVSGATFASCSLSYSQSGGRITGLDITSNSVFYTTATAVYGCALSGRTISSCASTGDFTATNVKHIDVVGSIAYIINAADVVACDVSGATLSNCQVNDITSNSPWQVQVYGPVAYVSDFPFETCSVAGKDVTSCAVNTLTFGTSALVTDCEIQDMVVV